MPTLLHPSSRGTVRLESSDAFSSPPVIDPRFLTVESDVAVLAEGMRTARKVMAAARDINPSLVGEETIDQGLLNELWRNSKGKDVGDISTPSAEEVKEICDSADYVNAYVKRLSHSIYHPGKCKPSH